MGRPGRLRVLFASSQGRTNGGKGRNRLLVLDRGWRSVVAGTRQERPFLVLVLRETGVAWGYPLTTMPHRWCLGVSPDGLCSYIIELEPMSIFVGFLGGLHIVPARAPGSGAVRDYGLASVERWGLEPLERWGQEALQRWGSQALERWGPDVLERWGPDALERWDLRRWSSGDGCAREVEASRWKSGEERAGTLGSGDAEKWGPEMLDDGGLEALDQWGLVKLEKWGSKALDSAARSGARLRSSDGGRGLWSAGGLRRLSVGVGAAGEWGLRRWSNGGRRR